MRILFIILFFAANSCLAQSTGRGWQLEIMPGVAGYKGDLTESYFPVSTIGPSAALNVKYDFGEMVIFRAGIAWAKVSGDDKDNKTDYLKGRNLDFKTNILEASLIGEIVPFDPEVYYTYPYFFLGVGLFRFDPYTYDKDNKKTSLRPLNTEGQGLAEYPDRKKYSLTQFCVPFGGGWKIHLNAKYALAFELGVRFLFTDYLDDVSKNYVDMETLLLKKGPKAVELAFRGNPLPLEGEMRGNPGVKDMYVFSGFKLTMNIGKWKE